MTNVNVNLAELLDGKKNMAVPEAVDLAVLQEAQKYNVDLQNLENVAMGKTETAAENVVNNADDSWSGLDVKLFDMVNLVFDKADYPIFVVQDDYVVYVNQVVCDVLHINSKAALHHKFLELVYRDDWNLLANNIGEMLTSHKEVNIRFNDEKNKILGMNLRAIYLSDIEHFSFILVGDKLKEPKQKNAGGNLYDEDTGLPSFFLFEDRLQMAVLAARESGENKNRYGVGVLAINIDNINDFKKLNLDEVVIKRIADNLVFNLPKVVTVSKGLKYHFWILLDRLKDNFELDYYIRQIKEILERGFSDNFTRHNLVWSIGCSIFPQTSLSAKEVIEHAIAALREAQKEKNSSLVVYKRK